MAVGAVIWAARKSLSVVPAPGCPGPGLRAWRIEMPVKAPREVPRSKANGRPLNHGISGGLTRKSSTIQSRKE